MCWIIKRLHKRTFLESLASNSKGPMKCVSPNNRPYQTRSTLVDINSNETRFFFYLPLVLINVVEAVTLLTIHMLEFVFQMK